MIETLLFGILTGLFCFLILMIMSAIGVPSSVVLAGVAGGVGALIANFVVRQFGLRKHG